MAAGRPVRVPFYTGDGDVDILGAQVVQFVSISQDAKFTANAVVVRSNDQQLVIWWDRYRDPPGFVALRLDAPGDVVVRD